MKRLVTEYDGYKIGDGISWSWGAGDIKAFAVMKDNYCNNFLQEDNPSRIRAGSVVALVGDCPETLSGFLDYEVGGKHHICATKRLGEVAVCLDTRKVIMYPSDLELEVLRKGILEDYKERGGNL